MNFARIVAMNTTSNIVGIQDFVTRTLMTFAKADQGAVANGGIRDARNTWRRIPRRSMKSERRFS